MFDMRLRLLELMAAHKPEPIETAYGLAKASKGAINETLARRLVNPKNPPKQIAFRTLDALCDTLKCEPSQLLERD